MEASRKQATLGKMILGITVTDLGGRRISFSHSAVRSGLNVFAFGSDTVPGSCEPAAMFASERKQALHDRGSGCVVVRQRKT